MYTHACTIHCPQAFVFCGGGRSGDKASTSHCATVNSINSTCSRMSQQTAADFITHKFQQSKGMVLYLHVRGDDTRTNADVLVCAPKKNSKLFLVTLITCT